MTVAWVAREVVWPDRKDSDVTLDYATAIKFATQPGHDDGYYRNALWLIVTECGKASETLRSLAQQVEYPTLRNQALLISKELVALLTNGPSAQSRDIDGSLIASCTDAVNEQLTVEAREKSLDHVKELAKSGLTAMWLSPLAGDEAKQIREAWCARLLRTLPQPR